MSERLGGVSKKRRDGGARRRQRYADADGGGYFVGADLHGAPAPRNDPVGGGERGGARARMSEQDEKGIRLLAGDGVVHGELAPQPERHLAKKLVAGTAPQARVYPGEMIDIDGKESGGG